MSNPEVQTQSRPAPALLLSELYPPAVGGTPVLFEEIYSRLGGQVVVMTDRAHAAGAGRRSAPGLSVTGVPLATRHWGLLDAEGLRQHWRVARAVRGAAPRDGVVHCARALPEGVAAWIARRLGGPRYICWAHGEDIATARQSREFTLMTRRVCHGAAANLANSRNTGRMLEELGVPAARIHVVHPGVDVTRFRPDVDGAPVRERYAPANGFVILSVGRLQRRKGHDLAIAAIARLRLDVPVHYVIVGDGEERPRLEALVHSHGLGGRVHLAGEVPAADLPKYYAACDLFLLPNRIDDGDVEGFGIVFLEAAASGRATIGGRSGGVGEAVADGETGVLVGGDDADELAAAIGRLARDPERRQAMGRAGRERASRCFTWDRAAQGVRDVHAAVAACA